MKLEAGIDKNGVVEHNGTCAARHEVTCVANAPDLMLVGRVK